MTTPRSRQLDGDYWPQMTVELTNVCNLHCSYCVRDDEALHHSKAQFFPPDLLRKVIESAREAVGLRYVSFTGGEATIHPRFGEILEVVESAGLQCGFITNGWHFDRVYSALRAHRAAVRAVAFSLDGATESSHDRWRGKGSFIRVMKAVARCCFDGIPFIIKTVIRRDTVAQLEPIAILAARLGASAVHFSHLMPTSAESESELALSLEERAHAEQEVGILAKILRMPVGVSVGHYDVDPSPPCPALGGASFNVDYRGRLTLCCNLSGYRGAAEEPDVVADLTKEDFSDAYGRLRRVAEAQAARRREALAAQSRDGGKGDLNVGSPCLFCLHSFGKIPWQASVDSRRSLPVLADLHTAFFS